jgi:putative ABC transport system permease protein
LFGAVRPRLIVVSAAVVLLLVIAASRATSGPGDRRLRDVLLVAQVAVAVVLLVAAGLLTRNAQRMLAKSPGFDVRNTLVVAADVSGKCYATSEARTVYVERLVSAVAALPGVESAALTDARFRVGESVATLIEVDGRPKLPDATESAAMRYVSPESFGRCA